MQAAGHEAAYHPIEPDDPEPALAAVPDGAVAVIDGLAYARIPDALARHAGRIRLVALIHHPLAEETGLDPGERAKLADSERRALSEAGLIVTTSPTTTRLLVSHYGAAADRILTIEPGTDPAPLARGSRTPWHLLAVGSLIPRKGYDLLLSAVEHLDQLDWRLDIVGAARDPAVGALVERAATGRIRWLGELDRPALDRAYDGADLLVSASLYEGYGMAIAEALARGLPVVAAATGAVPETLGAGGLLAPPGDAAALASAIREAVSGYDALRARALRRRAELPDWPAQAARFAAALG